MSGGAAASAVAGRRPRWPRPPGRRPGSNRSRTRSTASWPVTASPIAATTQSPTWQPRSTPPRTCWPTWTAPTRCRRPPGPVLPRRHLRHAGRSRRQRVGQRGTGQRELPELGIGAGCAAAASAAIMATADHRVPPDFSPTTAVVLDADLAILAAEPARYEAYVTGVRAEYAHVDDEGWRTGRAAVVAAFLHRPVIFVTAPMHAREHRARANLSAELSRLRAGGLNPVSPAAWAAWAQRPAGPSAARQPSAVRPAALPARGAAGRAAGRRVDGRGQLVAGGVRRRRRRRSRRRGGRRRGRRRRRSRRRGGRRRGRRRRSGLRRGGRRRGRRRRSGRAARAGGRG